MRLPSWLGDLVQAEPALRALGARVPADRLSLAAPADLLALLDGVLPGARRLPVAGRGGERAADWRGHDVAVLLTGSFRSAWTAALAQIPRRVGHARDLRRWLLTDALRPALERGGVPLGLGRPRRSRLGPRYLPRPFGATCVELVGLLGVGVRDPRPRLSFEPAYAQRVLARLGLDAGEDYVVANVGARPGSAKGFPPASWVRVLDVLAASLDAPVVLTSGPGEEEAVREVARAVRRARVLPCAGPAASLVELAALLAGARLVLATDSGPRHLAVAVGAPVASVSGPTDPRHSADQLRRQRMLRVEVPCGPCHRERCPLAGAHANRCMHEVDPEDMARLALELVE